MSGFDIGPPSRPSSAALAEVARDVAAATADQLKNVRSSADSWQKGLAGLLTVVTSVLFLKGKDSIDKLSEGWQYAAAFFLILGGVLAVASAYFLLRAAHGRPGSQSLDEVRADGRYVADYNEALRASSNLGSGQWLFFAMLVCVAVTVLITWFGDAPSTAPAYQISNQQGACGSLAAADNGRLKLVQDADASAVLLRRRELGSLRVVAACPR